MEWHEHGTLWRQAKTTLHPFNVLSHCLPGTAATSITLLATVARVLRIDIMYSFEKKEDLS